MRRKIQRFNYKKSSYEEMEKRANQNAGAKDSYFKDEFNVFKVKEGDMCMRFLPPTWKDAEHYGFEIYVHRGIGADKSDYLCLAKMKGEVCPLCEEREVFSEDADYASKLKPQRRYVVWLINRDDEKAGALLWSMAWTIDRDIARISVDKRTKEVYFIDDTGDGWDLNFTMEMVKSKTYSGPTFIGYQLAKRSSVLFPEEKEVKIIEDFITVNPIPNCLKYYDYDYLTNIFNPKKEEVTDVGVTVIDGEDDIPYEENTSKDSKTNEDVSYTWEEIHEMSADDLDKLTVDSGLLSEEELNDFEDGDAVLADKLCEFLTIKKPSSGRAKLKTLRNKKRS